MPSILGGVGRALGGVAKVVGRFAKGVLLPSIQRNIDSEDAGEGNIDYVRLTGSLAFFTLVISFVFGKINLDDLTTAVQFIIEFMTAFGL